MLRYPAFAASARDLLARLRPDVVICTFEEMFFWARAAEDDPDIFAPYFRANPPFKILKNLHRKDALRHLVASSARAAGVCIPETRRFGRLGEGRWVCKPAFSRWAAKTKLDLSAREAGHWMSKPGWLAQRQVTGREFCTWAFFVNGAEVCSAAYEPAFRMGIGSGIGLAGIPPPERAAEFARKLATRLRYSGQLAFDWIENESGCHLLECNPRSTSGTLFFDDQSLKTGQAVSNAIEGLPFQKVSGKIEAVAFKGAMLLNNMLSMLRPVAGAACRSFLRRAREAVHTEDDLGPVSPWVLLLSGIEVLALSLKHRCSPVRASTIDAEWNGSRFWESA
ncbi:MAG: hypothetical protein JNG86_01485 [Verrucomicrobiaceae bacterium]|nr:hypothetical protein [Verrucomicrobiaceae bacterium]